MSHNRAFNRSRQTRFRAVAIGLGLTLLVAALAAVAGAASNRAPRAPGIVSPGNSIDGIRYGNHGNMQLWATSSDPDGDRVSYRYRIFLFGSPANLYDSGWRAEATPGWGVSVQVPSSAPIPAGMTYVLTAQARDSHGALSPATAVSYSVFSDLHPTSQQSVAWYHSEYNLIDDRKVYNTGLTQGGASYLRQKVANLADQPNDQCYNSRLPAGLRSQMLTRSPAALGNITVLGAAANSMETVMREIRVKEPVLAVILRTAGSLCYRNTRPSGSTVSNHSWGLAIDFRLYDTGAETYRGNHNASMYTYRLWRYMHRAGWYWGGAFSTQDNMHFEASANRVDYWLLLGLAHHA